MVNSCEVCTKSVYPLESVVIHEKTYHKICFKCQDPECGVQLSLKSAQPHAATNKVYCSKHYPKEKATSMTSSVELDRAKNAPKLATVNQQKRGDGMENPTITPDAMSIANAKNSHNIAKNLHNDNLRGTGDVPTAVIGLQMENAINAPKLATVNQQKRGDGVENPNVTNDSLSIQNAKKSHQNAQKLHNDNVRGTGDKPNFNAIL